MAFTLGAGKATGCSEISGFSMEAWEMSMLRIMQMSNKACAQLVLSDGGSGGGWGYSILQLTRLQALGLSVSPKLPDILFSCYSAHLPPEDPKSCISHTAAFAYKIYLQWDLKDCLSGRGS